MSNTWPGGLNRVTNVGASSSCRQCGEKLGSTFLCGAHGAFCSRECAAAFGGERQRAHDELRGEPLAAFPDAVDLQAFERLALKIAVYAVSQLDGLVALPFGIDDPDILALGVKEQFVAHLPEEYVRTWQEGSGWGRSHGYTLTRPVPKPVVLEAMRKAGFCWNVAWY